MSHPTMEKKPPYLESTHHIFCDEVHIQQISGPQKKLV